MRVIIATICPKPLEIPRVTLASKLSCGPVELLLVHSNVTQLVGLTVDCLELIIDYSAKKYGIKAEMRYSLRSCFSF